MTATKLAAALHEDRELSLSHQRRAVRRLAAGMDSPHRFNARDVKAAPLIP